MLGLAKILCCRGFTDMGMIKLERGVSLGAPALGLTFEGDLAFVF